MKREILSEEVDQIINQSFWGKGGLKLDESSEQGQVEDLGMDAEADEHTCPLCESAIQTPITDDKLVEHISMFLDIINQIDGIGDDEINAIKEAIDEEFDSEDDSDAEDDREEDESDEEDDSDA
jgi:hypothetical protein